MAIIKYVIECCSSELQCLSLDSVDWQNEGVVFALQFGFLPGGCVGWITHQSSHLKWSALGFICVLGSEN